MLPLETYELYIKPYYTTASWRFYQDKHQIVIGEDIFKNLTIDATPKQKALYLRSFLYHELAHSIWTEKNLQDIDEELKMREYSFRLFNLFEDARIEEKMRLHTKKYFSWSKFEELHESENPLEIFFYIIQSENRNKPLTAPLYDTVYNFYKDILACEGHMQIIQIMGEWYKRFPLTQGYINEVKEKGYLFMEESNFSGDNKNFNELIHGLENTLLIGGNENFTPQDHEQTRKKRGLFSGNRTLLSQNSVDVVYDTKLRDMLLHKMKQLFLQPKRATATMIPAKKLHIKNLVARNEKIFKRNERESVKKNITIILDLSSSMHQSMPSMRLIVDVLNTMCEKSIIEATLILSAVSFGRELHEKLKMPLEKGVIEKIVPKYAGEALHNTMSKNLDLLKRSDYVWILTDGFIDEKPLDKNFYHKHKIKTHAFYIGNSSFKSQMELSFDHVICEDNVLKLAAQIFTLIK
jgi:hypothetical protein